MLLDKALFQRAGAGSLLVVRALLVISSLLIHTQTHTHTYTHLHINTSVVQSASPCSTCPQSKYIYDGEYSHIAGIYILYTSLFSSSPFSSCCIKRHYLISLSLHKVWRKQTPSRIVPSYLSKLHLLSSWTIANCSHPVLVLYDLLAAMVCIFMNI